MVRMFEVSCIDDMIREDVEYDDELSAEYAHGWNGALKILKENAKTHEIATWTRLEDEFPKAQELVLLTVTVPYRHVMCGYLYEGTFKDCHGYDIVGAEAWLPIPEAMK